MLNEAQIEKLDDLLKYYDEYFYVIHEKELEGYKWEALKVYNSNETNSDDKSVCFDALKESLVVGDNLIDSRNKFVLLTLIDKAKSKMQELFCQLIHGDRDTLETRLANFVEKVNDLKKQILPVTKYKILTCDAMTCLAIIKPDEYYLYRHFVFKKAYMFFYDAEFRGNPIKKACEFHDLCNDILEYVSKKDKFLVRYHSFLYQNKKLYTDESNHLLIQNILYIIRYYPNPLDSVYKIVDIEDMLTGKEFAKSLKKEYTTKKYDLEKELKENENKRLVGELGEDLVYEELLRQNNNKMELNHISKEDNYSLYDIKYDKIYIEVKTFSYQKNKTPSFFISQEEVDFCRDHAENYQLWFVIVDRKKKHWWYKIFDGDIRQSINLDYSIHGNKYYYKFKEEQLINLNKA